MLKGFLLTCYTNSSRYIFQFCLRRDNASVRAPAGKFQGKWRVR